MNVEELRTAVRAQLDLDKEDLGDGLLDQYLLEAFQQTTANELRWPWLETSWVVNATSDGSPALLPDDIGAVASVVSSEGEALEHVSHEDAENYLLTASAANRLWRVRLRCIQCGVRDCICGLGRNLI